MYELKRAKKIEEQVKLGEKELTVLLSVDEIIKEFNIRYNSVLKAEQEIKKYKDNSEDISQISNAMEEYEKSILKLLELIFGKENTEEILKYYENNFIEMMYAIIPFISNVIVPNLTQYMDEERKNFSKKYKSKLAGRK